MGINESIKSQKHEKNIEEKQLDRIEEKFVEKFVSASEKSVPVKTEKPLIDLPSQREKVMFKTSQSKTLEIVDKMLSNLKIKTESTGTSTSTPTARTISKKEIISKENTDSDTVSSVSSIPAKRIFDDDFP